MALKGQIGNVGLSDIAQLLHLNKKTGMLKIDSKEAQGVLYFNNGTVVDAETKDNTGEIAAYELFQAQSGTFEFIATPPHKKVTIKQTLHDLVLESARQKDTIKRLREVIPDNDLVFRAVVDPRLDSLQGNLTKEEVVLLNLLDGTRDVNDLVEDSGLSEFKVLTLLVDLYDKKYIESFEILKVLEYEPITGMFVSEDTAYVDTLVYNDWKEKLINESRMRVIKIKTQSKRFIVLKLAHKKKIGNKVKFDPSVAQKLKIKEGEKLIVKPISRNIPKDEAEELIEDFFD